MALFLEWGGKQGDPTIVCPYCTSEASVFSPPSGQSNANLPTGMLGGPPQDCLPSPPLLYVVVWPVIQGCCQGNGGTRRVGMSSNLPGFSNFWGDSPL